MDRMHESLGEHSRRINLPTSRSSTKRVLIMSYLEVKRDAEYAERLRRTTVCRFSSTILGGTVAAAHSTQWQS